jgi:hypothetical protein
MLLHLRSFAIWNDSIPQCLSVHRFVNHQSPDVAGATSWKVAEWLIRRRGRIYLRRR